MFFEFRCVHIGWSFYFLERCWHPQSKRVQETESSGSAPKRIRGSAANWGRAGFEADSVMKSHCSTWQNASLKELNEDNERYLWRRTCANTSFRGADRVVAISNDHELRLDDDSVRS